MKRNSIKPGEITVGKPLAWDVYDDQGALLLHTGYIIETSNQLDILMSRGIFHISDKPSYAPHIERHDLREEVSPFQLMDQIYSRLEEMISLSIPASGKDFPASIMNLCGSLQQACLQDTDATLSTILLGPTRRYSIKHSIDVAIICEVIGQALGMPDNKRISVIAASLTENIAMMTLSDILSSQVKPLTDEQRKAIQRHPARGMEILQSLGVKDHVWLDAVLKHHESPDGKGYPEGLHGDAVPSYARLISMADFYCAKISDRSYRSPLSSHEAMQFIFPASESRIDAGISELFVKTFGIYLPGTFVSLKNNQVAVVTRRGAKIHSPIVHAVTGKDGMLLPGPMYRDTSNPGFEIAQIIPPRKVTVKVNRYQLWGYGKFKIGIKLN